MTTLSDKMKSDIMLLVLKDHIIDPSLTVQEAYDLIKCSPLRNMHLLQFCQEVCKTDSFSKSTVKRESCLDPLASEKTLQETPKTQKKWEEWPLQVCEELLYVLEENDKGSRRVTMGDYMGRMKTFWGLEDVTEHSVKSFCKDHGRKGWSK